MKWLHWRTVLARMKTLAVEGKVPTHTVIESFKTEHPKNKTSIEWAARAAIEQLIQQGKITTKQGTYEGEDGTYFRGTVLVIKDADDIREEITPAVPSQFGTAQFTQPERKQNAEENATPQESNEPSEFERRLKELAEAGTKEASTSEGDSTSSEETGTPAGQEPAKTSTGQIDFDRL